MRVINLNLLNLNKSFIYYNFKFLEKQKNIFNIELLYYIIIFIYRNCYLKDISLYII